WRMPSVVVVSGLIALAGTIGPPSAVRRDYEQQQGLSALVASASMTSRSVEPRLCGGFPWSPFRASLRTDERILDLQFAGALATTLRDAGTASTPGAHHAEGVAQIL